MEPLLRTPLTHLHEQAGAKLAPFAGWTMPLQFRGTLAEHAAVRDRVGVFDVSHLGTIWVTGPAAPRVVDGSFSNDALALADGGSQYTLCLDAQGGILDDLIVYRLAAERWCVVPNAANTAIVADRLRDTARTVAEEARGQVAAAASTDDPAPADLAAGTALVDDASTVWAILAVQGPDAFATTRAALGLRLDELPWGTVAGRQLGDEAGSISGTYVLACRTGYTGELGGELVVPAEAAGAAWTALCAAGAEPAGLAARDTLRLEMGYPLHGSDLSPAITPWQARLGWAVALDRDGAPRTFVGREALVAARVDGPTDRLLGLRSEGRRPLRAGCQVHRDGDVVGATTSGGFSPTLGVGIALAMVDGVSPGEQVTVDVRGSRIDAEVVRPPFVERDPRG